MLTTLWRSQNSTSNTGGQSLCHMWHVHGARLPSTLTPSCHVHFSVAYQHLQVCCARCTTRWLSTLLLTLHDWLCSSHLCIAKLNTAFVLEGCPTAAQNTQSHQAMFVQMLDVGCTIRQLTKCTHMHVTVHTKLIMKSTSVCIYVLVGTSITGAWPMMHTMLQFTD